VDGEFHLILLFVNLWFGLKVLLQAVREDVLNHVWVAIGEELCFVSEGRLVGKELFLGLVCSVVFHAAFVRALRAASHGLLIALNRRCLFSLPFIGLLLSRLLDQLVPGHELLDDVLLLRHLTLHPRGGQDIRDGWSVGGVELEHSLDQGLELGGEEAVCSLLVLAVGLPEDVSSVTSEASVEGILGLCGGEGWVLSNHDEQNNRASK